MNLDEVYLRTAASQENFLTDALGSTIALADQAGAITTTYSYEPYGKAVRSGSPTTNSQTYTGREDDGTGLYYYRARYYHLTLQRFISEDPIGLNGGLNTYAYVSGNPVSYADPRGEFLVNPITIGAAIGGVTGTIQAANESGGWSWKTRKRSRSAPSHGWRLARRRAQHQLHGVGLPQWLLAREQQVWVVR